MLQTFTTQFLSTRQDRFLATRTDEFESRRREVCKVSCDIVIRGTQSGPALLPTLLIGGFGEGAVDASLRLALAIAQNGSKDQHSKLASSGILVPVGDLLKAALSSGDLYRFSAALALVRFCGPHVVSGTSGGIQSVRDAIIIATKVLTLPVDPGASDDQTRVQESLKAECVRAIESLSKNASLWSVISKDALPSIISYLNNRMSHSWNRSNTGAAALRAVLQIVQVPSHAVFAAECGLADSLGKLLRGSGQLEQSESEMEIRSLALRILHILVSRQESRRYCNLMQGKTLADVCSAIGATTGLLSESDSIHSDLTFLGIEILHFIIADIHSLGDTAEILHSKEAKFFAEAVGREKNFVRLLCATLLQYKTGMIIKRRGLHVQDEELTIPSSYGCYLRGHSGPCAGFQNYHDAAASLLFTVSTYACVVDSDKSESFWNFFLARDLPELEEPIECKYASLALVCLFLSLISSDYFLPREEDQRTDCETLLYPLLRYRLLEHVKDFIQDMRSKRKEINDYVLGILVFFEVPRICVSVASDPALLDLSYEVLMTMADYGAEDIMNSFLDSKDSIMSLLELLNLNFAQQMSTQGSDIRRFLASTLESLASDGALTEAVHKFDVRSSAIDALAVACLSENETGDDDDDEALTSSKLSTGILKCLVDLCTVHGKNDLKEFQLKSVDAVSIAKKLGKKICEMVLSRFLERARMQRYEIEACDNIMETPDVAMLCAISQHEQALRILRSIGGFHALALVAGEGELSALEALAKVCINSMPSLSGSINGSTTISISYWKGCKDEPILLLEADTYLSILSLFAVSDLNEPDNSHPSMSTDVECAAFNLLSQLCITSSKGRQLVTVAPGFQNCLKRALELVASFYIKNSTIVRESDDVEGDHDVIDCSNEKNHLATLPPKQAHPLPLVEAALTVVSSTILSIPIQEIILRDDVFIKACFHCAKVGSSQILRSSAVRVIARLVNNTSTENRLIPEEAAMLLCEMLAESYVPKSEAEGVNTNCIATLAADGLLCVFGKLTTKQRQSIIVAVGKAYTDVIRSRSLCKTNMTATDRLRSGKLAFSLTRVMLLSVGSEDIEIIFGSSAIPPLVGTVQWRYDSKTTLADDELVYWDASTAHSIQILASWLEQGKSLKIDGASASKTTSLKDSIWMVARPGKAPRKALDFGAAIMIAAKTGEASSRLSAERILNWLNENI